MFRRSDQMRRLGWGAVCCLATGVLAGLIWGGDAIPGAMAFGALATGLQLLAALLTSRLAVPAAIDHLKVYALGVLLRLSGVVLLGLAVAVDRTTFPPLPSALGYLGTVLPLLYLETRLAR